MADNCSMNQNPHSHTTSSGVEIRRNADRTVTLMAPGQGIGDYGHTIRLTDTEFRELVMHGYIGYTTNTHTYPEAK